MSTVTRPLPVPEAPAAAPVGPALRVLALTNMWPTETSPHYGTFIASQMRSIEAAGAEVEVAFVDGRRGPLAYLGTAARMLGLNFTRGRYDLIHVHTGHCAVLACLQRRYPVLVSYVGYDLYGKPRADGSLTWKSRVEASLFRALSRLAAATITKSAAMEDLLPGRVRPRNTVLPNGVDRTLFRPGSRKAARLELGWPQDEVTVLFAARPRVERKRFPLAQAAVGIAAGTMPALRLRVCAEVAQEVVPMHMNAADVLMLTSIAEGSPNVVKEALACDLPVVAIDSGDVAELLAGVARCRVLPPDAGPEALADALVDVLSGAPQRSDGRARSAHLDQELVAQRLLDLYGRLAARRQPGP